MAWLLLIKNHLGIENWCNINDTRNNNNHQCTILLFHEHSNNITFDMKWIFTKIVVLIEYYSTKIS